MNNTYYTVADHNFLLSQPQDKAIELGSYAPFIVKEDILRTILFHLTVVGYNDSITNQNPLFGEKDLVIGCFKDDIATITITRLTKGGYLFEIAPPNEEVCSSMICDAAFQKANVVLRNNAEFSFFGLNNCLMIMYALAAAPHNTLLIHASAVIHKGKGFIFQGKSGTGKSTHSRLWLETIEGTELLNDDNPVIRIIDNNSVKIFGSPWSGKTPCYRDHSVPLEAIVRLRQAPHNSARRNSTTQGFASLKPTCSTMPWDKAIHQSVCDSITQIVEKVPTFTLECLPDKEAALICYNAISEEL